MKKTLKYLSVMLMVAFFATSCEDLNKIDFGSADEAGEISVTYSQAGVEVKSLSFGSGSRLVVVDVALNNEDLKWDMKSDSDWITIAQEPHQGSGSFSFTVAANPDFDDRQPATLTFVAGQFEGFELQVDQRGNVFVLSGAYHVASSESGTTQMTVSVPEGVTYSVQNDDWISVEGLSDGATTNSLTVSWEANLQEARYGKVEFVISGDDEPDASFDIFQFGSEVSFSAEGVIEVPAEDASEIHVLAPADFVDDVNCPDWMTYSSAIEGTYEKYSFSFADNPSDCKKNRTAEISLKIKDYDAPVELPAMYQSYCPAYGFISAEGLKMFAQAWNSGEDVSDWMSEAGTFEIKSNVNMAGITDWKSIGTEEYPFTGVFDGKYREIQGMDSSYPLFGVCEDAILQNITIAANSTFARRGEYADTDYTLVPLAAKLTDCTVSECVNKADVTLSASNRLTEKIFIYTGGLLGEVYGDTEIVKCENHGKVTVTKDVETSYQKAILAQGGIVAFNDGATISQCENNGSLAVNTDIYYQHIGGIAGVNNGTLESCSNNGKVSMNALRTRASDQARAVDIVFIGGIAGLNYSGIHGCTNAAEVYMKTDAYYPYIGGVAGGLGLLDRSNAYSLAMNTDALSVSSNSNLVTAAVTSAASARYGAAGGLYGGVSKENFEFDFTGSKSLGAVSILNASTSVYPTYYAGGLIGFSTKSIKIKNAQSAAALTFTTSNDENNVGATKIALGGVIGYAGEGLEVTDSESEGNIRFNVSSVLFEENTSASGPTYVGTGGIAGLVMDGFKASGCSNASVIDFDGENSSSNGFPFAMGGIVGRIAAGDAEITDCHNKANLKNSFRTNTKWNNGDNLGINYLGGIIGQYRTYKGEETGALSITSCSNTGTLESSRGAAGGIIGFANNVEMTSCTNSGSMASGSRIMAGGIAGVAFNGTVISESSASCIISASTNGAGPGRAGGIVAVLRQNSNVISCSFSGEVKKPDDNTSYGVGYAGAIVGVAATENSSNPIAATPDATCKVENCKAKGKVADVDLTESNIASYLCGVADESIMSGNQYWK